MVTCMAVTLLKGGKQDYVYQCFFSIYTVNSSMPCKCGTFCSPIALYTMQHLHNYGQVWSEMLICLLYFGLGLNKQTLNKPGTDLWQQSVTEECAYYPKRGGLSLNVALEKCIYPPLPSVLSTTFLSSMALSYATTVPGCTETTGNREEI